MKTNHEFVILDASGSMQQHTSSVIKVTDTLISHLASQAKTFPDIETRISVYSFSTMHSGGNLRNLVWDMDVLRMPSIAGMYHAGGGTPLCEAMVRVMDDITTIPVKYGDHSVLAYLVTDAGDGGEHSASHFVAALPKELKRAPETWTLAALVPSPWSKQRLANYGFAPGNIEIWDPSRKEGVEEMGERIVQTSAVYTSARSAGAMKSTTSLFSMASPAKEDLQRTLTPMTEGSYYFEQVTDDDLAKIVNGRIDQFMQLKTGKPYTPGSPITFYQMDRRVRIQQNKRIAVAIPDHARKTVQVYTGAVARTKLGLPDKDVRVSPGRWKDYKVFVETTSFNRKLYPGTSVLVMR